MFAPPLSAKTETKPTNDEITPSEENTDKPAHSSNEAPSKEVIHLAIVQKILKFRPFSAEYPQHGAYHHKDKELQIKKAVFLFNTSSVHLGPVRLGWNKTRNYSRLLIVIQIIQLFQLKSFLE